MFLLNDETAVNIAKELTIVAMNNNMISPAAGSAETAEAVYRFYETMFISLTTDGNN